MSIRCVVCKEEIKDNDLVKMDADDTLTHVRCIHLKGKILKEINTYHNLKVKYPLIFKQN
ncbi:hypothetical protein [Metabacillus fastidiosus]|uniref:Uncharacterized protein n=1 Tax=Metabacillus fastidiosus TaxID=1458 RepID=A0ABU6NTV5_9BACI|nr:hypothetical protein [Metabacillus fastidiosus]MED4400128.1 hypothetical protein [Metabacillus fastidiosus]MED4452016.1 hypothetical protein [Metabacillus fastidiosus]MED4462610.1 hypothetical protein [Metabacillus fastidiosus]